MNFYTTGGETLSIQTSIIITFHIDNFNESCRFTEESPVIRCEGKSK